MKRKEMKTSSPVTPSLGQKTTSMRPLMQSRLVYFARVAYVIWMLFVFYQSFLPARASGENSRAVGAWLEILCGVEIPNGILRKCAHVLEYFVLGALGILSCKPYAKYGKGSRTQPRWLSPLFVTLLVALCDETLQTVRPGRSGEVRDVWIDFIGALLGTAVVGLLQHWYLSRRFKRTQRAFEKEKK